VSTAVASPAAPGLAGRLATPAGAALLVLLWGALNTALQLAFTTTLTTDHAAAVVATQALAPGYDVRQPPLFEWALWPVARLLGPNLLSVLLVKHGFLALGALFTFLAARRLLDDARLALFAVLANGFVVTIGWQLLVWGSHTTALVFACGLTLWAWVRLLERPGLGRAAVLGLALGLGLLSKFSYAALPLGLLAATLLDAELRARLRARDLLAAASLALLVASPFLLWLARTHPLAAVELEGVMREGSDLPYAARAAIAPFKVVVCAIGYLLPPALVVLALFRPGVAAARAAFSGSGESARLRRMALRATLLALGLTALAAGLAGATRIADRHMVPIVFAGPVLLVAWGAAAKPSADPRWRLFGRLAGGIVLLVLGIRLVGFLMPEAPWCDSRCRQMRPYEALREPLAALGAERGMLVGILEHDAGNLRALFPEARTVWLPRYALGEPRPDAPCLLVWTAEYGAPADELRRLLPDAPAGVAPDREIRSDWPHLWKGPGWRQTVWGVRPLDPAHPFCALRRG